MCEDYLLLPHDIAAVVNTLDGFRPGQPVLEDEVRRIVETRRQDVSFYCPVQLRSRLAGLKNLTAQCCVRFLTTSLRREFSKKPAIRGQ